MEWGFPVPPNVGVGIKVVYVPLSPQEHLPERSSPTEAEVTPICPKAQSLPDPERPRRSPQKNASSHYTQTAW